MSATGPGNPFGTDPTLEGAADAALAALRKGRSDALAANGLSDDTLRATVDAGSSWFTSEGKASIARNLQAAGQRIDDLAGKYRAWAEAGQRDDGTAYGWGDWKQLADALGGEFSYDYGLAWDASLTGPLLSAAGKTLEDVGGGLAAGAQALGNAELSVLGLFKSPWAWGVLALGAGVLFLGPSLAPTLKRWVGAVREVKA